MLKLLGLQSCLPANSLVPCISVCVSWCITAICRSVDCWLDCALGHLHARAWTVFLHSATSGSAKEKYSCKIQETSTLKYRT